MTLADQRAMFALDAATALRVADEAIDAGDTVTARRKLSQAAGLFDLAGDTVRAREAEERMETIEHEPIQA